SEDCIRDFHVTGVQTCALPIFMVHRTSYMFITGPDVIRTVTREEVTKSDLGGADTHSRISGVAHMACGDEQTCLASIRKLMSFQIGRASCRYIVQVTASDGVGQ